MGRRICFELNVEAASLQAFHGITYKNFSLYKESYNFNYMIIK